MKKLLFSVLIISMLVVSCSTPYKYDMLTSNESKKEDVQVIKIRNKDYYISTRDDVVLMVCAYPSGFDDEIYFSVGIENLGKDIVTIYDTQFKMYKGNADTNEWQDMGEWNAEEFYTAAEKEYRSRRAWSFISKAASLAVGVAYGATEGYDTNFSSALVSSATTVGLVTSNELLNTPKAHKNYLEVLESSMFYSSQIRPNKEYQGTIIYDAGESVDFKLEFTDSDGYVRTFMFTREDKPYVLNHWLDNPFKTHNTIMGKFDVVNLDYGGFIYNHLTPDWGYYWGLSLGFGDSFNFGTDIGATMKVFPYSWLMFGAGIGIADTNDFDGSKMFVSPQLGLGFNFNFITLSITGNYRYVVNNTNYNRFGLEIGAGISF